MPYFSIGGIPVVTAEWMPTGEILVVIPEQKTTITYHEGVDAGKTREVVVKRGGFKRFVNIVALEPDAD